MKIDNEKIHEQMKKIVKQLKKDEYVKNMIISYNDNTLIVFFKDEEDEQFENE
ncbi:hypothetical protein [Gallibacterium genomosp. 3]|uniref:hypothetical protein n=1 Tax=Gallibacterium genomosp. 3 TaxID=505345 RepID=UPI0012E784CC|nr:hypothetical protein [Gallibacterium genomosp. 3]